MTTRARGAIEVSRGSVWVAGRTGRRNNPTYGNPDRAPEQLPATRVHRGERRDPPPPYDGQPEMAGVPGIRQPSTAPLGFGGVPLFPDTPEGQAERLAYYAARKLNHLPHSLLDYHDVIRGRETPAERRSRQRPATGRRR